MKKLLLLFLFTYSSNSLAAWVEYSTESNGDIFFYDNERIIYNGDLVNVWTRIQYKTSLMGAASYQSLLKIDCSERYEATLQNTFFSDKYWTKPAMASNTKEKPKIAIKANSATQKLAEILCKN